ncbi:hypothetical protein EJ05DRAFT_538555 [Pseudovirgaria hyperparasitica]|uniref:Uncharacterized protein n=1 Tax=Pseudovirgaria hyperparasitica TaxID=470096 RepID=A0A6A6W5V6_9PEZI|nr:uncharacterized protein EJ05DRAFT_538555 [Pseudovirgaria hyperparasitica]KAF2757330.1 hypothetical protein EJ05DRAFT_538555 [Pseudovirgaria hyperparasitica]
MSAMIARSAIRAARTARPAQARTFNTSRPLYSNPITGEGKEEGKAALKAGARRDPELYVLFAIMTGVFGLAGWHFSRNPTSSSSESAVGQAAHTEPWKEGGGKGKYQFHPGGDKNAPRKDAPSALNVTIIPNVNLPKSLHDQFNKYGKEDW